MITIWDIFRYLYKWKLLIVAIVVVSFFGAKVYTDSIQSYYSDIIIEYEGDYAEEGKAPNGSKLDVYEIITPNVISKALSDIGRELPVDSVRNNISITPLVPSDVEQIRKKRVEAGEEYEYIPTQFSIRFNDFTKSNGTFVRNFLDALIKNYTIQYSEKYLAFVDVNDIDEEIKISAHDYLETAELIDEYTSDLVKRLTDFDSGGENYRSPKTGYTFTDLSGKYSQIQQFEIPTLFSDILRGRVSKNKDILIKKYTLKRDESYLSMNSFQEKTNLAYELMIKFAETNIEVPNSYNYANKDKNNDDVNSTDVYFDNGVSQKQTTYDELVDNYVISGVKTGNDRIDGDYYQSIINIFSTPPETEIDKNVLTDRIEKQIKSIAAELSELYQLTSDTMDGYNAKNVSDYINYLSGVNVGNVVNGNLYMLIAAVAGFIVSVLGVLTYEILFKMQSYIQGNFAASKAEEDAIKKNRKEKKVADKLEKSERDKLRKRKKKEVTDNDEESELDSDEV